MPINPELYATSVLATGALILMPGPIVTLVIANSLAYGTRTGVQTALGASTGNALLAAGGALGLVAIMGYLGDIFDVVRWLGATYLIYLGIKRFLRLCVAILCLLRFLPLGIILSFKCY